MRIGDTADKIHDYNKEQWAVQRAQKIGVPVADILEVGNSIIDLPYMIQTSYQAPMRGITRAMIRSSSSSANMRRRYTLSGRKDTEKFLTGRIINYQKIKPGKSFLENEFLIDGRLAFLKRYKMLTPDNVKKLEAQVRQIKNWNRPARLNHGDLRLKNVIINEKGKIAAILDWENCSSNIAPEWIFQLHCMT